MSQDCNPTKKLKTEETDMNNEDTLEHKETYVALSQGELRRLQDEELNLIKKAGFYLNYENGVRSFVNVRPGSGHTVFFDINTGNPHRSKEAEDQWNDNYVKLPYSRFNQLENNQPVWSIISNSLKKLAQLLAHDPHHTYIQDAIRSYNKNAKYWNFGCLDYFFEEELEGIKGESILKEVVPNMVQLALDLPNQILKPIPILKSGESHSITLTQRQCACILANAFFCTFPGRNRNNPDKMPFINFDELFNSARYGKKVKIEKLKCIFHYFNRITQKMPDGVVTFSRVCIPEIEFPDFRNSKKLARQPLIQLKGTIEDCIGALQMDFANKYLGGGVLNHGCVQEEIRFLVCPELIVSMLFTERMELNEAVLIRGCEQFSSYTGYADSFEWWRDFEDTTARDQFGRRYTDIVALDALKYRYSKTQFEENKILRELKKCYCGFKSPIEDQEHNGNYPVIATGNWGCGAFKGDRQLKFLIQLIAASEADRDIIYFTFNDQNTVDSLSALWTIIKNEKLTVGEIYKIVVDYYGEIFNLSTSSLKAFSILEYFKTKLGH